jgi:hypothetical protein
MKLENKLLLKALIVCAMIALLLTCSCTAVKPPVYKVAWCTPEYLFYFTDSTESEIKRINNNSEWELMYNDSIVCVYPF